MPAAAAAALPGDLFLVELSHLIVRQLRCVLESGDLQIVLDFASRKVLETLPRPEAVDRDLLRHGVDEEEHLNVTSTGETTYDIYAGAGLNKTSNGVKVGTLTVNWDGSYATVSYNLVSPNVMEELHIYAGVVKPATTAPGQYGTTVYFDPKAPSYTTTLPAADTTGDGIWIIAHAVSCYPVN